MFAFAGPLKQACGILFGFSYDQLHHPIVKEQQDQRWGKSPREILQWLGTDILRTHINRDFFIMHMEHRIKQSKADYVVVSDVRFPNEAQFIKSMGGKVVKILRPGASTTVHSGHVTEQGIPDYQVDAFIMNDGTLEEFQNNVKMVIGKVLYKPKSFPEETIEAN